MTQTEDSQCTRVGKDRGVVLRRFIPLVFVSSLAAIAYGVAWLTSPIGQEAGGGPWRAIGAIDPRISPLGRAIAFSYQGAIWKIDREGGAMTRLTKGPGFDSEPVWSPDEKRIAYFDATSGELNLIDSGSGEPFKLPAKIIGERKLCFHPDGKRLLGNFRVNAAEPGSRYLAWLDLASGTLQHVFNPPQSLRVFCLADDGEQIAFASHQDIPGEQSGVNGPQADLFVMPASGGQPKKLRRFPSRIFDMTWSRNQLYFSSDVGGAHNNLWTFSVSQPEQARQITAGHADEDRASLNADGRWLVYTDNRENATALAVRNLGTGDEQLLSVSRLDFGQTTGALRISVVEKDTGRPLTARLSIQEEGGKFLAPPGSLYRIQGNGLLHFYAAGQAQATAPAGKYVLRAFRGLEYRPLEQRIELASGQNLSVKLELDHWNDPAARSWYSGESHIHANYGYGHWYNTPETMHLQLEGEGLKVANFMVANSDGDGVFDREFFRGVPDSLSSPETVLYWNEEFRATLWGHMTLLNLKRLVEPMFTGFRDTTNPWDVPTNADIADTTHLQEGHVNFTHPASPSGDPFLGAYAAKSVPVDVALGKIDSLDINWGEPTLQLWYRLLNCGFRLPASAGTDCFLNRIRSRLPGSDRAYVKIDNGFSYSGWIRNLKAGKSFVTGGPLLEFTVDHKPLGETIQRTVPGTVVARGAATWQAPLDRVELIYNGAIVATGKVSSDRLTATVEQIVKVDRSGWICFRAYAQDGTLAHTSPIYVTVGGKPAVSRSDAEYFVQWIDRLEAKLNERSRVPPPALRAHVESQLNTAREVYRKIAAQHTGGAI
jgi:TolB protein